AKVQHRVLSETGNPAEPDLLDEAEIGIDVMRSTEHVAADAGRARGRHIKVFRSAAGEIAIRRKKRYVAIVRACAAQIRYRARRRKARTTWRADGLASNRSPWKARVRSENGIDLISSEQSSSKARA